MIEVPTTLVLFVCKTIALSTPTDVLASERIAWENAQITGYAERDNRFVEHDNDRLTGHEPREWATPNSMMLCRRHEVQMYDPAEGKVMPDGEVTQPVGVNVGQPGACARVGFWLQMDWDRKHKNSPWRVWRVGCPSPIIDRRTGQVIGYKLPDCGHRDTVVCEIDSVI